MRGPSSLQSRLMAGLVLLTLVALSVLAAVMVYWLPLDLPSGTIVLGVGVLVVLETILIARFGLYLLRDRILKPMDKLVDAAEAVAAGDHRRRLELDGPEEVRRVAASVNGMAEHLISNQERMAENIRSLDETNRKLAETRRELVEADKLASTGQLAAGVAHEIGNPLGAIIGYVEVARRRGNGDAEWIDEVEREALRIHGVVRGLLDFATPHDPVLEIVSMNDLVERTIQLLETQGQLKNIEVRKELGGESPTVHGDPGHLEQVLVNLLLNSVQAIKGAGVDGEIIVRTAREAYAGPPTREPARRAGDPQGVNYAHLRRSRTDPAYRPPGFDNGDPVIRLEVQDNGEGLKPGEEEQIFEPFYTTREPGQGTGLGLTVSSRLIKDMGGVIRVSASPGEGTRFAIFFPLEAAS